MRGRRVWSKLTGHSVDFSGCGIARFLSLIHLLSCYISTPRQVKTSGDAYVVIGVLVCELYYFSITFSIFMFMFRSLFVLLRAVVVFLYVVRTVAEGVFCDHSPKTRWQH